MIKQWQERTAEITGILTTRHIQEAMQAEIYELRAENTKLREVAQALVNLSDGCSADEYYAVEDMFRAALGEK